MHNRVQHALARRERMRRSRDFAWTVFAASGVAAVFGCVLLIGHLLSPLRIEWWIVLIYAGIAIVSSFLAVRSFGAGRRLTRRLNETQSLSLDEQASLARPRSAWDEILSRRGERTRRARADDSRG